MTIELNFGIHQMRVFADVVSLIRELSAHIHRDVVASIQQGQHYYLSLAGGSTPKQLYQALAGEPKFTDDIWRAMEIYFGDERYVHYSSADSNFHMAKEAWLDHVSIPSNQIHPIPTGCKQVEDCVRAYQQELTIVPGKNGLPCLDLMLLGMGDDGHTASLFPDTAVLNETERWVAGVYVEKHESQRITLTYPVINNARQVIVLVTGDGKADMVKQVMTDPSRQFPIQRLNNPHGIIWYVDDAAAELL